jgi:hypothetical protein
MKRIFLALFVLATFAVTAQESVLLRANYNKGDKYLVTVEQIQNMGLQGGVNMTISMEMLFTDITKEEITSNSKITAVKMDILQGGTSMSYDSTKENKDLDQMGQMMKSQVDPMLKTTIINVMNPRGKVISMKTEPANPAMDQFSNQSSNILFPEEKVSVGSTWESENENMGMKMKMVYKVVKIEAGNVYLDISGTVSGMGEGTIKGNTTIDIATGTQTLAEVEVSVSAMGQQVKVTSKTSMKKA